MKVEFLSDGDTLPGSIIQDLGRVDGRWFVLCSDWFFGPVLCIVE